MRLLRERDVLDVLALFAVVGLGYLHLPWRGRIRRGMADAVATVTGVAGGSGVELLVLVGVLCGGVMLYYLAVIAPARG